jgi:hypothetical protein
MARDTVAVDTRARLATSWIFMACSLGRTGLDTRKNEECSTVQRASTSATVPLPLA